MPDPSGAPDRPREQEEGHSLLASISREMVRAMKRFYGKGPVQAKSYLMDDLLFVVMRGGTTTAEKTMVEADQEDVVRHFRQRFENEMKEELSAVIEQLTGRKVINYQSQILFDPDMSVEIFVFDQPATSEAIMATAEAQAGEEDVGSASDEAIDEGDGAPE